MDAAAKALGINPSACKKWANAAGITAQYRYTQVDNHQFHTV